MLIASKQEKPEPATLSIDSTSRGSRISTADVVTDHEPVHATTKETVTFKLEVISPDSVHLNEESPNAWSIKMSGKCLSWSYICAKLLRSNCSEV